MAYRARRAAAQQRIDTLCIVLTALSLLAGAAFVFILIYTGFLATKFVLIGAAALLVMTAAVFLLTMNRSRRVCTVIGVILFLLTLIAEIAGSYYLLVGRSTLTQITTPQTDYVEVGVYVRKEDTAQTYADVQGRPFGVLETQGREAVDDVIAAMSADYSAPVTPAGFTEIEDLMEALITGKTVDVIVIDKAFLELLDDAGEHADDLDKIREIYNKTVGQEQSDDPDSSGQSSHNNSAPAAPEPVIRDVFSCYISGIDCFGTLSRRSRSDVNILATVNVRTGQILLVSTPRDFYVTHSASHGQRDKLTNAGIYGINVSKDAIGSLYGVKVDYYFRVNFDGFKSIIKALGGITVYSDYDFKAGSYHFVKGPNEVGPERALAFARERHAFASGDRQRGRNQMAVIKGVIDKAISPVILTNYKQILDGLAKTFETNMPYEMIQYLIRNQTENGTAWNITTYSANGTGASLKPYSQRTRAYVMVPNQDTVNKAKALISQVRNGQVPTP